MLISPNRFYLFCFFFLLTSSSWSQKVDTMTYQGKHYFVYPYPMEVRKHSIYYSILNGKKDVEKQLDYHYKRVAQGLESSSSNTIKHLEMCSEYFFEEGSGNKGMDKKLVKAMRQYPFPLLMPSYSLSSDIIPSLDPIPDGEYVQLFEDFCMTDAKGRCQPFERRVAGIFTIKNNLLQGEAVWMSLDGDILKQGTFENGLREGEWMLKKYALDYRLSDVQKFDYVEVGTPTMDTVVSYFTFKNGIENGPHQRYNCSNFPVLEGEFINGERAGLWTERMVFYETEYNDGIRLMVPIRDNAQITKQWTLADPSEKIVVHHPWIRKYPLEFNDVGNFYDDYNIDYFDSDKYPNPNIFQINFEEKEDLDLEEESDLQEEIYFRGELDEEYYGFGGFRSELIRVYDPESEMYRNRGALIDSLGMVSDYSGVYESFYGNGQLAFRYEFENGGLVREDTVFWDNGSPFDVIVFNADSNQYVRSIYDLDGKLYQELIYDSLGDYIRNGFEYDGTVYLEIEGYRVPEENQHYYFLERWDTLQYDLTEKFLLFSSWDVTHKQPVYRRYYDPQTKTLVEKRIGLNGFQNMEKEIVFGENYKNWTGTTWRKYGPYEMRQTASGTIEESLDRDSIEQSIIRYYDDSYEVATDQVLLKDGVPYTGPVHIEFNANKGVIGEKTLELHVMNAYHKKLKRRAKHWRKEILNHYEKGKKFKSLEFEYVNEGDLDLNLEERIYMDMLPKSLQAAVNGSFSGSYYSGWSGKAERIEGMFLDGKPQGTWNVYNKDGSLKYEIPFEKGVINGTLKSYETQMPLQLFRSGSQQLMMLLADSVPEKPVNYLNATREFKNDKLDGASIKYSWLGEVLSVEHYKEGLLNGKYMDRNKLVTTYADYKRGMRDGYIQTYLTLPGRDSILLFDLNFQDGLLQGESKSYHLNGDVAKRGFFLDGSPIEDYEAFDSLGFRYHYVKFEYGYPIEEKLWEENELSVRYLFDWKDSIYFVPSDITETQSLDRLVASLGLASDYLQRPYYGRSTLVDKEGIKYHMTKYYPNDTIARDGNLDDGKKIGLWKYYNYDGLFLYEVDYKDSIFSLNDSIRFHSKGIYTKFSDSGDTIYKAHIIERFEKYDCAHTDHYEIRQLYTIWEKNTSVGRMDGFVQNFYDNGVIQSEGELKDGLPTGAWKIYDPFGKLNQYGYYVMGKRDGRWLSGDLSKTKYLGDICLNPNLPNLKEEIKYRENLLDITITNYKLGKSMNKQYYDVDMNQFSDVEDDTEFLEEE